MVAEDRRFDMPCGIEAALHRLASAVRHDGYRDAHAHVLDGRAYSVMLWPQGERKENGRYLVLIDGEWLEYGEVDDAADTAND